MLFFFHVVDYYNTMDDVDMDMPNIIDELIAKSKIIDAPDLLAHFEAMADYRNTNLGHMDPILRDKLEKAGKALAARLKDKTTRDVMYFDKHVNDVIRGMDARAMNIAMKDLTKAMTKLNSFPMKYPAYVAATASENLIPNALAHLDGLKEKLARAIRAPVVPDPHPTSVKRYIAGSLPELDPTKFTQGKELGKGGFGVTYVFTENVTGREFVVKKLLDNSRCDDIEKELTAYSKVPKHPNVINVIGFYVSPTAGQCRRMVMEFCSGGELANHQVRNLYSRYNNIRRDCTSMGAAVDTRPKKGPLDEATFRKYAKGLIAGMDHIHRYGIHCDIKPANAFICNGEAKWGDFGMFGNDGSLGGTRMFMGPTCNEPCDKFRDYYALGMTLWEVMPESMRGTPEWQDIEQLANVYATFPRVDRKAHFENIKRRV